MKFVFFFILPFIVVNSSAQIDISCPKLTDSTLNYFYIGVDNPIKIIGQNIPDNYSVIITGGGATISKISTKNYIVRASTVTDDCEISIIGKKGKVILKKDFKVRIIGDLITGLAGLRDTTLSKHKILLNPFLTIVISNCYYQHNIRLVSFSASFEIGEDVIDTNANGSFLSPTQLNLVKKANIGSIIFFDNIRTIGPDSRTLNLTPFWIKIE